MTISDERWLAERRSTERARGRCVAALAVGVLSVPVGLLGLALARTAASGTVMAAVTGLLGAASVGLAVSARGVSAWSRLGCALPGALTAVLSALVLLLIGIAGRHPLTSAA